jgi:hypothetical protein
MFFEDDFSARVFQQPKADAFIELLKSPYAFGTWPKNRLFSELALIDLFRSDPCLWQVAVKPASRTSDRLQGQPFSSLWKKP